MVGWHYQLNGHEFKQTLGDSEGLRSLACCSPWGHRESDTTERLNNNVSHGRWKPHQERSIEPPSLSQSGLEAPQTPPLMPPAFYHLTQNK